MVSFGDFEVDFRSGELRKRGVRIPLQGRPLQVLEVLVRMPGELVTREALQRELWGGDTFVDFETGLNAAVRRLREALGDAADVPRFVETLPRRGYRFIAPVKGATLTSPPVPASARQPEPGVSGARNTDGPDAHAARPRSPTRRWLAAGAIALCAGGIGAWLMLRPRETPPPAAHIVALTTTAGAEVMPTLSPDGQEVAFAWNGERADGGGDRDLWLKIIGGGQEVRQVTSGPDDDVSPSWSPDGSRIAFLRIAADSPTSAEAGVYVVSPLGGAPRRIGGAPALPSQLSWSRDSRFVVAMSLRRSQNGSPESGGLQRVAVDGSGSGPLTTPDHTEYHMQPAVSADGRWLAYAACPNRTSPQCDVQVVAVGADGTTTGAAARLTHHQAAIHGITWTPDGRSLVYAVSPMFVFGSGMGSQLWRVPHARGSPPERIEAAHLGAFAPAAVSGHARLAFAQDRLDFDILRFVPPDGETPVVASSFVDYAPSFSPDGRHIAFESSRSGEAEEIWMASPDGSNAVQLTGGAVDWRGEPRWRGNPNWSPDGRRIVFTSRGDAGTSDVWTVDIEGGRLTRLTNDPPVDAIPTWSPDGRWIYYRQDRTDGSDIVRVAATGGVPERVTRHGALYGVLSADGTTLFYSKPGRTSALYAMRIGGVEQTLVDCALPRAIATRGDSLYYVGCGGDRLSLYQRHVVTGKTRTLGSVNAAGCCLGLAVSPDGKTILFARTVTAGADLLLIEDFK